MKVSNCTEEPCLRGAFPVTLREFELGAVPELPSFMGCYFSKLIG
jgi:hypothetical protein